MSLEEKFAKLTVDDVTTVVETVKAEGVEKSGLATNASVLAARCASSDDNEAIAALKTVKALAESVPTAQVFTKESLGACKYIILVRSIARVWRRATMTVHERCCPETVILVWVIGSIV